MTCRRHIEQAYHCVREALSVMEWKEHESTAIQDLEHARMLIEEILPRLRKLVRA